MRPRVGETPDPRGLATLGSGFATTIGVNELVGKLRPQRDPMFIVLCAVALAAPPMAARDTDPSVRTALDSSLASAIARATVDTPVTRRPRAIEYSDWYSRRLVVHRLGSYT